MRPPEVPVLHPTRFPRAWNNRSIGAVSAAAVRDVINVQEALSWYQGAVGELYATLAAQSVPATGSAGGIFANELFMNERGEATIFIPCAVPVRSMGPVTPLRVPGVELAIIMHAGTHADIDRAYGSLAAYVAENVVAVEGPIREYYVVGRHETTDESAWRTEIGCPIFHTSAR